MDCLAEPVLVRGFGKMGMQANAVRAASSAVARISDVVTLNGEQGASAICTIASGPVVVARDQAFAVGEDRVLVLHHAVRWQPAVALRAVHRAAGHHHPHAEACAAAISMSIA